MNKFTKCMVTSVMSLALLTAGIVNGFGKKDVQATKVSFTKTEYKTCAADRGYVYTPNVKGTLPAVIFCHGSGGMKKDYYNVLLENWINAGYISPCVFIMPFIDSVGHNAYVCKDQDSNNVEWLGKLINRMDTGEFDTKDTKIDKENGYSIAGYSMGGSSALLAGIAYRDKFKNVGGGSPSIQFHDPANGVSWLMESSETRCCEFTKKSDKHLMLSSGSTGGEDGHLKCANRSYDKFGEENGFAQIVFNYISHDHNLFAQEFFNFLYYSEHDVLPSDEILNKVFGSKTIKVNSVHMPSKEDSANDSNGKEENVKETKPVIQSVKSSLSNGTVKMGQNYTITVKATGENLKYQWEWCTDGQSWANSVCNGNTSQTINLVGKRPIVYYRCKVSNAGGTVTSDAVVIKDEATIKPTIQSVNLSLKDGTVKMGQNYTITVKATGANLKYQWEWCTDNKSWANSVCNGNTSQTINLVGKRPIVYYRCKVSNAGGTVTSNAVVIKEAK